MIGIRLGFKIQLPGTKFHEQVTWELEAQSIADVIIYYFAPNTISPITLLELGYFMGTLNHKSMYIYCPKTYDRYGNVVLTVNDFSAKFPEKNVNLYDDSDLLLEDLLFDLEMM